MDMPSELQKYITLAEGFQYSVNIAYDLNRDDKIKTFIPTNAAMELIEDILLSTYPNSTDRARVLVGAYGKGKSHIILMLLSLLLRKDITLFDHILTKIRSYNEDLYDYTADYIKSDRKLLPVIIQGSTATLSQAFLGSLEKALAVEGFEDFMPETHFTSALKMIENWEENYPETYAKLQAALDQPTLDFKLKLKEYNSDSYEQFVNIYPTLTSGGAFNPFLGFDVVELYTKVALKLKTKGYDGIFVVYDEFSKFLEAGITKVSSVDIKLLQDLAEKCTRSGDNQLHLLLIAHKDISNYIDKLPKTKVDGWKGVSERFKHVELHNNFSQVYEIIATVIGKDRAYFKKFFKKYTEKFIDIEGSIKNTRIFAEIEDDYYDTIIRGCYPLHPISTFILPRLSEKVAQNERTLFTFLSSNNKNTLSAFIENANGDFPILTPDYIYDYFEQQFKKEAYTTDTYKTWQLTAKILDKIAGDVLGCKIIKTIALIYIVGQFEKLPPIPDIIIDTFKESVDDISQITVTLRDLQNKQYVIYQRKTNHYLKLKNTTGIDIGKLIAEHAEKNRTISRVKDIVNDFSFDSYIYPTSYNDNTEITRYFDFTFIESEEFFTVQNWDKRIEDNAADGLVFGIIVKDKDDAGKMLQALESGVANHDRIVFAVPLTEYDIDHIAYEYQAVKWLKEQYKDDDVFTEELNIYIEDLEDAIGEFVTGYTKPETKRAIYYYHGQRQQIYRKAQISALLSDICSRIFYLTPVINNEAINKDFLPTVAVNSRNKVIAGLLNTMIEPDLGLVGTGQDVSIMRSSIINTGLLADPKGTPQLLLAGIADANMQNVISEIEAFFKDKASTQAVSFGELYTLLTAPQHHIGLKKGVIPLYIAAVLHFFKQHTVITRASREIEINAELLSAIGENPSEYYVFLENWTEEKNNYIASLEILFATHIVEKEKEYNTFNYIVRAMQRWFISLPKYAKEMKSAYEGGGQSKRLSGEQIKFINSLKIAEINAREYLFEKIFDIFNYRDISPLVSDNLTAIKSLLDNAKPKLISALSIDVRGLFLNKQSNKASLSSVIKDWYEGLNESAQNHLYNNGEERLLELFRTIPNDEVHFIERLAKAIVGLRIDDWEEGSILEFRRGLESFKATVEKQSENIGKKEPQTTNDMYRISFIAQDGGEVAKTFNKTKRSKKARLLENDLLAALDDYGQAITENEKRQVLMDIIERMCR